MVRFLTADLWQTVDYVKDAGQDVLYRRTEFQ
jgi:hypothetical protein